MLAQEDLEQIRHLVQEQIREELGGQSVQAVANVRYELELRDRMLHVEEGLRHQRELMEQGFRLMEKRFEQVDKRFEQVDKRFEEMREDMNARFGQMDKRFVEVNASIKDLAHRMDRFMYWTFAMMVTIAGVVVAVVRFIP